MSLMTDKELEQFKENLQELNHTIVRAHLKRIVMDIAEGKAQEVDLRKSPLYKLSPAQVFELLEELSWRESDILIDRHWTDITFWSPEWKFELHLSFNGFKWTMSLYREEEVE